MAEFLAQMERHKAEMGIVDPLDIEPCRYSPANNPHEPKTWPDGSYCDGGGVVYSPDGRTVYPRPCPCYLQAKGRDNQMDYINHLGLEIRSKVRHADENQYACGDMFASWQPSKSPAIQLSGISGLGKTIAGHRAVLRLIVQHAMSAHYISARSVAVDCSLLATNTDERYRAEDRLTRYTLACRGRYIVMLDDLGRERQSDATTTRMCEYIDALYERRAPCIITTNLIGQQLQDRYGRDIISRMCDASWMTTIVCRGKDLRRPQNAPAQTTQFQTEDELFAPGWRERGDS
jgi:DNA replication protein DnaC